MYKKRALIYMIAFYVLSVATLVAFLVGAVILDTFSVTVRGLLIMLFIIFLPASVSTTVGYLRLRKMERKKAKATLPTPPEYGDDELNAWLQ